MGPDDVRRLVAALADADDVSKEGRLEFQVGGKGFAWTWLVRETPRRPRVPRPDVLAVRCSIERKEMLIEASPTIYFDEPHYQGYPAVLVRLDAIDEAELTGLLRQGIETLAASRRRAARA
ncbi:MAG TPA: MmcQ/YjbR family DNA-binding protein [Caulobacteraceae bacterium]|jgi:hypothetical protein